MRKSIGLILALGLTLVGARTASATDYWDLATEPDNGIGTNNELVHGTAQQHDLEANAGPVTDEDWYRAINYPHSSYEVIVESTGGDIGIGLGLDRIAADGTTVLQPSESANVGSTGFSRALRWENFGLVIDTQFLRVRSGDCTTTCGPEDQYHIRYYDTTVSIPRFNNSGTQVTILLIQNPLNWTRDVGGSIYFWDSGGNMVGFMDFFLPARASITVNTSFVAGAGTITVTHNGGYGNLAMKAVALEPATGFSFDTPGLYRLH